MRRLLLTPFLVILAAMVTCSGPSPTPETAETPAPGPSPRPRRRPRHCRRQLPRNRLLRQPPRFQRRHPRRLTPTHTSTKERSTPTSFQPHEKTKEFPVEPPVWGNDSDQVQVGSPGFRKNLIGVPLVFSPDIHSEFGSASKTNPRHGSIQRVENCPSASIWTSRSGPWLQREQLRLCGPGLTYHGIQP